MRGYLPGPVLVQRQGRPLRGLLRRRHDQDRDELPARTSTSRARCATAPATTGRRSRCTTRARPSPRSSTCRSRRRPSFFAAIPAISRHLKTLVDVGLGYVRLGQPAPTLSGGEAQRVKLASELQKRSTGRTVYVLDEPTTGLHFEDIRKLLVVLGRPGRQGQHGDRDRAQPRRDQDRRLGDRHGPRGRHRAAAWWSPRARRRRSPPTRRATPAQFLAPLLEGRAARRRPSQAAREEAAAKKAPAKKAAAKKARHPRSGEARARLEPDGAGATFSSVSHRLAFSVAFNYPCDAGEARCTARASVVVAPSTGASLGLTLPSWRPAATTSRTGRLTAARPPGVRRL